MTAEPTLPRSPNASRVRKLLATARKARVLVLGDVMLDHFLWGNVERISPEAPVPVVQFERESFVPGGAGNVARNLADLEVFTELFGVVGDDASAHQLKKVLNHGHIACTGLLTCSERVTSIKTRIIAHRQQVVRLDRESRSYVNEETTWQLLAALEKSLHNGDALILCDYAKGTVTQQLVDQAKILCRRRGVWLSVDPKPAHHLNLSGVSLLTPNRKEAFELAGISDSTHRVPPLKDKNLMRVADKLLTELQPALLLITLGDQGMLLCQRGQHPIPIATAAREVFDVSGAGDTVIATFTLAIIAGASPYEAAIISNHAAGIVVGKLGTATVRPGELVESFDHERTAQ
jgi:rfaE bifunctional protein kinase chain/domain